MQGRLRAAPGRGRELAALVLEGAGPGLAGCLLYVVGCLADDPDTVVVTEVWTDQAAHDASLLEERVRTAIAQAMPLLAGPPEGISFDVLGGVGLGLGRP